MEQMMLHQYKLVRLEFIKLKM